MTAVLLLSLAAVQGSPAASVPDLAWLSGCWKATSGTRTVTESWLPPDGGTMLGVSRTVSGDRTVEYEFIVVRAGSRGIEFVAKPSGQPEAVFTATRVTAREAVFENPDHDFPTRITYRRVDEGLLATVSGVVKGKPRDIEFRYHPADCSR